MTQRALIAALAIVGAVAVVLAVVLAVVITRDDNGDDAEGEDAGAEACGIYQDAVADSPEAIAPFDAMPEIEGMLPDLDDQTRTAFAALIAAADANPYMPGADPNATRDAAAEVRAVCLAEHGVKIAS